MQDKLTVRPAEGAEKAAKRVSSAGSWTGFCARRQEERGTAIYDLAVNTGSNKINIT